MQGQSLFPEGADRIAAGLAVEAETSMAELRKFLPSDPLPGEHAREDKVKNSDSMIHTAGRNTEDGDAGRGRRAWRRGFLHYALCTMLFGEVAY